MVELLHRGRFYPVPEASAVPLAANAWDVTIPRDAPALLRARREWTEAGWDGAVLSIDGRETEPALTSRIDARSVTLSVYHLG